MGKQKKSQWGRNVVLVMVVIVSTLAVCAFYNLGSSNTFTSETRKMRDAVKTFEQNVKKTNEKSPPVKEKKVAQEELKIKSDNENKMLKDEKLKDVKVKSDNENKVLKEEKPEGVEIKSDNENKKLKEQKPDDLDIKSDKMLKEEKEEKPTDVKKESDNENKMLKEEKPQSVKIESDNENKLLKEEKPENVKKDIDSKPNLVVENDKKPIVDSVPKDKKEEITKPINVIITFAKAGYNMRLQQKFRLTVSSLLQHAKSFVRLHILGEPESQALGSEIVEEESKKNNNDRFKLINLDIDDVVSKLHEIVKPMQEHFSSKPGSYYSDSLFFLSIAIHRILPETYEKIIMLDSDLKFMSDIGELYKLFDEFADENVIGIGHDLQPVYRHTFWEYRSKNPGTRVGEPKPNGLQGFNSGVLLLDLNKLRASKFYNSLLNKKSVSELTKEFYFQGHLGDQDFFTLLSMKYENLFYVLPCGWNRQLCEWWKDKGYENVWDSYFSCDTPVHIYHGNCNTQIP